MYSWRLTSVTCRGDRKGRILKRYGDAEFLENQVIENAKLDPKIGHPEYNAWSIPHLPIVHLTLRGFVVDAMPFCSCFDASKLRTITFKDCYDAGFYLPDDMKHVELRIDSKYKHKATDGRGIWADQEVKCLTYKDGKKVGESRFNSSSSSENPAEQSSCHMKQVESRSSSIPRYAAASSSSSSPPSASYSSSTTMLSGQGLRKSRFSLDFRKRPVSSVIEEDEKEE